jgi:endonuclease/exonuclease/phosphatase family metal-dependent hydrolase
VYGANKAIDRRPLWQNLLSMKVKVASNPWILCGDFNVVRTLAEKWGLDRLNSYELEFGDCLNRLEVIDLNFSGCFYTWNNKSEGSDLFARKLDRVMVNEE